MLSGLRVEPLIKSQGAFGFADSEGQEALDYLDICLVAKVRAELEMIQVGAKHFKVPVLWPVFHVTTAIVASFSSQECDLDHITVEPVWQLLFNLLAIKEIVRMTERKGGAASLA